MASTTRRRRRSWKKTLSWVVGIGVVVFILMQFVPYGRSSHSNPPDTNAFSWTDPQAEAIAKESCYDCHSNETKWWWATNIAPFSWLVQRDVDAGRSHLNFSEWDGEPSAEAIREAVNGEMPPIQYTMIHPGAKLTDAEKQTLVQGYAAGIAASGGGSGDGQSSTPATGPTAADTAEGASLVQSRCGTCHQAPTSYHAGSEAEAQALIENMIQRGATVSAAEEQALIAYFTR